MAASFILIFKRGNPIAWVVNTSFGLLGGVYYPITVLPPWLQAISHFLPVTYAIRSMEMAVYQGSSIKELTQDIATLLAFSALLLPLSLLSFKFAIRKAKMDGSLVHY